VHSVTRLTLTERVIGALMASAACPQTIGGIIGMASICRPKSLGTMLITWSMIVISSGLLVSLVWDSDGNPNTDNLPQAVVCTEARTAAEAEAQIEDGEDDLPRAQSLGFRWLLRRCIVVREWRWRPFGVPRRGP
jgi:hypothetical protein